MKSIYQQLSSEERGVIMAMTLRPGDIMLCGTSVGVGSMKPGSTGEVDVSGIGGYIGVKLVLASEDVTFMVRGANLQAIRKNGMKLIMNDRVEHIASNLKATNDYDQAGPQNIVIIALRANQIEAVANDVPKLFGPDTVVVTMQNGIPYWYFHRHGGALEGSQVRSVDPTGLLSKKIPA